MQHVSFRRVCTGTLIGAFLLLITTQAFAEGPRWNPYKDMSRAELAWQIAHVADMAQTYDLAGDRCYHEGNRFTKAFIGNDPSRGDVVAFAIASSYLHAHAGRWLDNSDAPRWVKWVARTVDLSLKVDTVHHNYAIGIRIGGANKPHKIPGRSLCNP